MSVLAKLRNGPRWLKRASAAPSRVAPSGVGRGSGAPDGLVGS